MTKTINWNDSVLLSVTVYEQDKTDNVTRLKRELNKKDFMFSHEHILGTAHNFKVSCNVHSIGQAVKIINAYTNEN